MSKDVRLDIIAAIEGSSGTELRLRFKNGRYQTVLIKHPMTPAAVAHSLRELADVIEYDPELRS